MNGQCISGIPALSCRGEPDGTGTGQGAFRFTDTATDASFINDIGLFYQNLFSLAVQNLGFSEQDCLVRGRAVLFTDDTGNSLGIGQAAVLVEKHITDLHAVLLFHCKLSKCSGRAYLAAQGAVQFTITGSGVQSW